MIVSITQLAEKLKEEMEWQATPEALSDEQYADMIINGLEKLYIDTNRPTLYDKSLFILNDDGELIYNADLPINEIAYIMLCAKMAFLRKVQTDVNNIVSYSTNALSVANADKPYMNIKDSLMEFEHERRILYYKMVDYTLGE